MPAGELFYNILALSSLQRRQHIGFGGLRSAQPDIIQNAALEQAAVLKPPKEMGVHRSSSLWDIPYISSAHPDVSALHIKEPADKVGQRGFAAAGGTYKATVCPG